MSVLTPELTVGQIVADRPSRSRVFQKLGIDFCCGGKRTLADACRDKQLDTTRVLEALRESESDAPGNEVDAARMNLTELCDHIEHTHHAHLKTELPRLNAMVHRVAAVHGMHYPWTVDIATIFPKFAEEMLTHMMKEERVLFPAIRKCESGQAPEGGCQIASTIQAMEHEHDDAGDAMEKMRGLSSGFTPPGDACNTFRAMLHGLAEIEQDLHQHVHKENNVLFPSAIARHAARQ
jgi:regulator of cell morphogenesis and NO signaling